MNIEFDSDNKKKKSTARKSATLERGNYEDLMRERKARLPQSEAEINEIMKDYHGQSIAIILVKEDENAQPCGVRTFIAGASTAESSIALAKELNSASEELIDMIIKSAGGDVDKLLTLVSAITNLKESEK